ncbi:MAG: hypothetical protein GYA36_19335 [Veillonellaceae bacterium]|nr:hypothetical protein [Veillonellaceae bacterium]
MVARFVLLIVYAALVYWTAVENHMVILAVLVGVVLVGALVQVLRGR